MRDSPGEHWCLLTRRGLARAVPVGLHCPDTILRRSRCAPAQPVLGAADLAWLSERIETKIAAKTQELVGSGGVPSRAHRYGRFSALTAT